MNICITCGISFDPEKFPAFLPFNSYGLCADCSEKELVEYMGKELRSLIEEEDRKAIEAEKDRIKNRWEILDL